MFDTNSCDPKWRVDNWKKGLEKISLSKHHKNAEAARLDFVNHNRHIDVMIDASRREERNRQERERVRNREYLSRLVDVTKTLSKSGRVFRGHDETESSHNRGNFLETVNLLGRWDHDFADHLRQADRNCTYLSNRAQNDLVHAIATVVREEIVQEIIKAKFFSVMMDDVSGKEQLCMVIRFVDHSNVIHERLLSFQAVAKTDATSLFSAVSDAIHLHKLEMKNIVGQCYDGASNMKGVHNGVQAKVKEIVPTAIYVHCYAHCLNLVLVSAMTSNTLARNFFGTLEALYCFVRNSNYHHHLFQTLQKSHEDADDSVVTSGDDDGNTPRPLSLKRLSDTRWACRFEAVRAVVQNYTLLLELLEKIVEDRNTSAKAVADGRGLLTQLQTFGFILCSKVLEDLLQCTNVISKYLQSVEIDLNAAFASIESTLTILREKRCETAFKQYFDATTSMCEQNDIEIPSLNDR